MISSVTKSASMNAANGLSKFAAAISTPARSFVATPRKFVEDNSDLAWAQKQCEAFKAWLNYIFQPSEDMDHEIVVQQIEDGSIDANTLSTVSLRTLILHQRMARAKVKANSLMTSAEMTNAFGTIRSEIRKGRLALRSDQDIYANLNLRDKILDLLLSYSTPWLRVGLETLFRGEEVVTNTIGQVSIMMSPKAKLKGTTPHAKRRKASGKVSHGSSFVPRYMYTHPNLGTNEPHEGCIEDLHHHPCSI